VENIDRLMVKILKIAAFLAFIIVFAIAEEKNQATEKKEAIAIVKVVEDNNDCWDRKKLKDLSQKNPAKFQYIMDIYKQRLEKLKEADPARYKNLMENRRERLKELKADNPDRYNKLTENVIEKLKKIKKEKPEEYYNFEGKQSERI
jgi:hypothetical protein